MEGWSDGSWLIWWMLRGFSPPPLDHSSTQPLHSLLGVRASAAARGRGGIGFTVAAFQDLLPHILGCGLDLLHLFADPRAGGLVAADGLVHVVLGFGHQSLHRFIFLHRH